MLPNNSSANEIVFQLKDKFKFRFISRNYRLNVDYIIETTDILNYYILKPNVF